MRDRSCAIDSIKMQAEIERCIPEADELQRKRFLRYYELLVEWNAKINLTAITDPEGVASRHFADSLLALELIPQGARLIDIGTGAGFPGIPLKIMRPDIELTLLDSLNKRIIFLNEVLKDLDINARTLHLRAEDGAKDPELRGRFDIATSRAVAAVSKIAGWTLPFVKKGGASLMYKGPSVQDELTDAQSVLKKLNADIKLIRFERPWGERCILVAEKR